MLESMEHGASLINAQTLNTVEAIDIAMAVIASVAEAAKDNDNVRVLLACATVSAELVYARNA